MRFPFNLPKEREFDVIGFGTNAVDFLIQVPEYPSFNSKIELTDYKQAAGGEVATTLVGLQRLGLKTSYAGRFGKDSAGEFGLKELVAEGVDVRFSETVEGARTQIAFIIIDERDGERTVIWNRDKKLCYSLDESPLEIGSVARILHLTPHDTEACVKLARRAKLQNTVISLDIDDTFEDLEELLPLVDILISSADFAEKLLGIKDKKDALGEIAARFGCGIAGLTSGEAGSLIFSGGEFFETEGFIVPGGCKDTTGAGDAFRTGFLYGVLNGESIEESARIANAVAALKCRKVGARTALPNVAALEEIIHDN